MHATLIPGSAKRDEVNCIQLDHFPVVCGRGEDVDVKILDRWVSRHHCRIEQRDGLLVVTDLGSKHGTWVNHQRVLEAAILPGDELEIGLTTLTAVYQTAAQPADSR